MFGEAWCCLSLAARTDPVTSVENPSEPRAGGSRYLIHKVQGTHLEVRGSGSRVPLGGALSEQDMDLICAWILAGAQNM